MIKFYSFLNHSILFEKGTEVCLSNYTTTVAIPINRILRMYEYPFEFVKEKEQKGGGYFQHPVKNFPADCFITTIVMENGDVYFVKKTLTVVIEEMSKL
jgi:hypothetical protein